jgi:ubiquitin-conjugating enzyme E2 J1
MNPSHPAVKRIAQEARSIQEDPSDFFLAQPLETDLFDWHFTILGPDESAFAGGLCDPHPP